MQSEDQLQAAFYQKAYNKWPQIRGLLFSVPNGSTRHPLEAMKLKATGLTPGIPDMILIGPNHPIALEFKTETGVLSPVQIKIHAVWKAAGIPVYVVRSVESALSIVENYLTQSGLAAGKQ